MEKLTKRRGSMALAILLSLAAVLTVAAAALAVVAKSYGGTVLYQRGLASVYAAESGANWGLAYVKRADAESRNASFEVDGIQVRVSVAITDTKVVIRSAARDSAGKNKRFLTLTCKREEIDGEPVVTVEDVSADAFRGN